MGNALLRHSRWLALGVVLWLSAGAYGQVFRLSKEQMAQFTAENPYGRFADGRPKVPDEVIEKIKKLDLDIEEAWGLLRQKGFPNQYDGDWKVLRPEKKLVGRAFTVQFMPARADVANGINKDAEARGLRGMRNQTAIDMLESGDVAVVDLYGKIEGGTFVGDKLAYYVQKTTGTGLIVDGALFYLNRLAATGMPAYYRGTHPSALSNAMLTGINIPVRIGEATVMPGDIVLGDRDGVLFIPPQMVSAILDSVVTQRARDEWVKGKFDTGKYKSGEIYGTPRDPELKKEFDEFIKQRWSQSR